MLDDRTAVTDTTTSPYSSVVRVDVTYSNGSSGYGTGVMIGANDVLTAAHVIYDADYGYATSVTVSPGKNGNLLPFGTAEGYNLSVPNSYAYAKSVWDSANYDYGVINLSTNLGNQTGYLNYTSVFASSLNTATVKIAGYPADLQTGQYMYEADGTVLGYHTSNSIAYDMYTASGMSGAPILLYGNQVVAVHVQGWSSDGYNVGTVIDGVAWNDIYTWSLETVSEETVSENVIQGDDTDQKFGPEGAFSSYYWDDVSPSNEYQYFTHDAQIVFGGGGRDGIKTNGNDTVYGNKGNDSFHVHRASDDNSLKDIYYGGQGDDRFGSLGPNDIAYGNKGADVFHGGAGDQIYYGGQQNDDIRTGLGNDIAYGNNGRDQFSNGEHGYLTYGGHDTIYGGAGEDTLSGYNHTGSNGYSLDDFTIRKNPDESIFVQYTKNLNSSNTIYDVEIILIGTDTIEAQYI